MYYNQNRQQQQAEMKNKKPVQAKLVMVGDVGVGKSSITVRYILDKFDIKMQSTLGAAYMQKIHMVHDSDAVKQIKLKIWDTAGQQKYKAIAKLYYKDCQAALVIYDVTRKQTFYNARNWVQQLCKHAPKSIVIGLVANKVDLLDTIIQESEKARVVDSKQGKQYAKLINAPFFQVSAKSKEGVDDLFTEIARRLLTQQQSCSLQKSAKLTKKSVIGDPNQQNQRKKCCEN